MSSTRIEKDTMGTMEVPADVLYGASTQRAVENFPVSGRPVPRGIVAAYALIKSAAAEVNCRLGKLDRARCTLIQAACEQIASGLSDFGGWQRHFPIDVFQTGSGTSTNMNANEVVANLVCLALGRPIGSSKDPAYLAQGGVHPNDHVNMGQSSNDTFPTAMHVAAAIAIKSHLLPAIGRVAASLSEKAREWDTIVKIGRTHVQDATPIRLGQVFSGFARQLELAEDRLGRCLEVLGELALGGTAVGTGINCHERFGSMAAQWLSKRTDVAFREAENHFEAQHAKDAYVEVSGHLRTIAVSLSKVAGDIRLMGCGPRCGIGELKIPAVQPGSSIMPGKVNPVICESVVMVCCRVIGHDATVSTAGLGGVGGLLDLHVAMPVMAEALLDSIHILSGASNMLVDRLLAHLEPDAERCGTLIEGSLAMVTSLMPIIGYDKSAAIAQQAFREGRAVRTLCEEQLVGQPDLHGQMISRETLNRALDPWSMTLPGGDGSAGG